MPQIPLSFATCSIGPGVPGVNALNNKLEAISSAGFSAIELAFPDLQSFATRLLNHDVAADNYADLCTAAKEIASLCSARGLKIMMLQPFSNFEGWKKGSAEREDAFNRAKGWIRIMEASGTDMLQVRFSKQLIENTSLYRLANPVFLEFLRLDLQTPPQIKYLRSAKTSFQISKSWQTC